MKQWKWAIVVAALTVAPAISWANHESLDATLSGLEEVPPVLSSGRGTFHGTITNEDDAIPFKLTYRGLRTQILQAHIHFAGTKNEGGVMVFLCGNEGNPCPNDEGENGRFSGTVEGELKAEDVIAVGSQGVAAGKIKQVIRVIRNGLGYVNVHTEQFPDGEIRGQVEVTVP